LFVETYNAALNKPAYQSGVYTNVYVHVGLRKSYPAQYANDGNRNGTCAITNRTANPWWAVDLRQPMAIYRVDLTTEYRTKTNITGL